MLGPETVQNSTKCVHKEKVSDLLVQVALVRSSGKMKVVSCNVGVRKRQGIHIVSRKPCLGSAYLEDIAQD